MAHASRKVRNYPFKVKKKGRRIWKSLLHHSLGLIKGSAVLVACCLFFSLLGAGGYLLARCPYFQVREVKVFGCRRIPSDRIVELTDLKGRNILCLNLKKVASRIKQERWIEQVMVKRDLPDRIEIHLKERHAKALVNLGEMHLVDETGAVFRRVRKGEYFDLPVFTGLSREYVRRNPQKSISLISQGLSLLDLAASKAGLPPDRISEVHIDPDTGFSLYDVENATQIRLGSTELPEKLARLKRVQCAEEGGNPLRVVDLRCKDKVFVTLDMKKKPAYAAKEVRKDG